MTAAAARETGTQWGSREKCKQTGKKEEYSAEKRAMKGIPYSDTCLKPKVALKVYSRVTTTLQPSWGQGLGIRKWQKLNLAAWSGRGPFCCSVPQCEVKECPSGELLFVNEYSPRLRVGVNKLRDLPHGDKSGSELHTVQSALRRTRPALWMIGEWVRVRKG